MSEWTDKPWERQKGESAQAYEAFAMYRDMGTERSIRAVSQRLGKSKTLIDRWSREKSWVERVRAYDNELAKEAKAKAVREHKAMTERHISIAMQIQKKALEALKNLSVENMSPKDIKEFIKMATDLERINRTLEETDKSSDESSERLADDIIAAYKKRKGDGNA
ncbi:MAG: hypothetical protein LUG91_10205 [Ruminococcus sp.]|nr:hypothetical protein [Ruminococcus sp.]